MTENVMETIKGCPFLKNLCSNEANYEIPKGMKNSLVLMQTQAKLTDEEVADLEEQIITMGEKGIVHYVIHTLGRGETLPYDYYSGDRYWECDYLYRATTQAVITSWGGMPKSEVIGKGFEPILVENLI